MLFLSPLKPLSHYPYQDRVYTKKAPKINQKLAIFGAIIFDWCIQSPRIHEKYTLFVLHKALISNTNYVIMVIMELDTIILSCAISATLQTLLIVALYSYWIIPKIIVGVRDEVLIQIKEWVDDTKKDLSSTIVNSVETSVSGFRDWFRAKRGNNKRQLSLAESYLAANLPDGDPDAVDGQDIINQAVITYGADIVRAVLSSMRAKKPAVVEQSSDNGGWV